MLLWSALALLASCDAIDALGFGDGELASADSGAAGAVAHLEQVRGQVVLERGGTSTPARLGYLYLRDGLVTAAEASAVVRFAQGQVLEVGPDARLVITEDQGGIVLNVERGLVLTRVPAGGQQGPGITLTILTPFGITRLGGEVGEVQIEVGDEDATVSVLVGTVELVSRNGESAQASAGQRVTLSTGSVQIEGRTPAEITLEPIPVTVYASAGRAEVRRQGQKRWKAVGRKGEPLADGDGVRVRTGRSTLDLQGSETRVSLEDQAEVVVQKVGRGGGLEDSSFDFRKGSLTLNLAPNQRSRVDLNGLELETEVGGQFGVAKTRDGFDVQAVAGDVKVTRGGKEAVVRAGQSARLSDKGGTQIVPADRAEVAIPTRTGMKVHHPGLGSAALSWSGDSSADYWVEVASDARFEQKLLSGLVHSNYINVPIPRRGTLHWRVLQKDRATEVDRGWAAFAPEPPLRDLARLRNEVQDGADKSTIYFQDKDKPPAVTFVFSPEEGAAEYRVLVYRADALDRPVADRRSAETKVPLEAGALTEGSYVWSVTPLDAAGAELRGGKFNKMEISFDNSVPNLVITSPRNGEGARGSLRATGVAPVGARLYVNGKPADLDDKNRFDMVVSPVGRPPVVIFRVSRPPASDTITVRTLRRR